MTDSVGDGVVGHDRVEDLLDVESIRAAWKSAAGRIDSASSLLLWARRDLLEVGFGDDHPFCRRIDELVTLVAGERARAIVAAYP